MQEWVPLVKAATASQGKIVYDWTIAPERLCNFRSLFVAGTSGKEPCPEITLVIRGKSELGQRRWWHQGLESVPCVVVSRPERKAWRVGVAGLGKLRPVANHVSGQVDLPCIQIHRLRKLEKVLKLSGMGRSIRETNWRKVDLRGIAVVEFVRECWHLSRKGSVSCAGRA